MPEKIRRVRRKRRSQSFPVVESFPSFRLDLPPVRVALYVAAAAVAVLLLVLFGTYGSKLYTGWHESRLLKRATAMLEKKDFVAANRLARQVLEHRRDSLPAFYILLKLPKNKTRRKQSPGVPRLPVCSQTTSTVSSISLRRRCGLVRSILREKHWSALRRGLRIWRLSIS